MWNYDAFFLLLLTGDALLLWFRSFRKPHDRLSLPAQHGLHAFRGRLHNFAGAKCVGGEERHVSSATPAPHRVQIQKHESHTDSLLHPGRTAGKQCDTVARCSTIAGSRSKYNC